MTISKRRPDLDLLIKDLNIPDPETIDRVLLLNALTHKSIRYDVKDNIPDNERLEYLGDAVLKLSVSQWLYQTYPEADEGVMSQTRAYSVSDRSLANIARNLRLSNYIILGKKEVVSGGKDKDSILANCMEAVIGAVFLCTGYNIASQMVINLTEDILRTGIEGKAEEENAKDILQKITQARFKLLPEYNTTYLDGPAHKAIFQCNLTVQGKDYYATGLSKKQAEQGAARLALKDLKDE